MGRLYPSEICAADLIPKRWKVVEDVEPTLRSAANLDLVSFLEPEDRRRHIPNETVRGRAKIRGANLGLADLKVALTDQAKIARIAEEAQVYNIVFSGTVLEPSDGGRYVANIHKTFGDQWVLGWTWLGAESDGVGMRLASCKTAA